MKKFTTLKEDLIAENFKSQEDFDNNLNAISNKLDLVKTSLEGLREKTWNNIAFNNVNEQLDQILSNLNRESGNKNHFPENDFPENEFTGGQ